MEIPKAFDCIVIDGAVIVRMIPPEPIHKDFLLISALFLMLRMFCLPVTEWTLYLTNTYRIVWKVLSVKNVAQVIGTKFWPKWSYPKSGKTFCVLMKTKQNSSIFSQKKWPRKNMEIRNRSMWQLIQKSYPLTARKCPHALMKKQIRECKSTSWMRWKKVTTCSWWEQLTAM